jgi:hypothetical protein
LSFITFRTAGLAAGALILTSIASGAFAQTGTSILTLGSFQGNYRENGVQSSTYTFSSSMIVNSIGFVTGGYSLSSASYGIGSTFTSVNLGDLGAEVDGIRWYTPTTGLSLANGNVLTVETLGTEIFDENPATMLRAVTSSNGSPNVTFYGLQNYTNSNIRVSPSNPGSNVAPEPGTFALALTGGAALIGICIRRRRNAG